MQQSPAALAAWWQRGLAALLVAVALGSALSPRLDAFAEAQIEAGLQRALVAFALARALNGVISVAQSTEVAIQPAGIGVALNPGELLDPVNDLVEQFSSVMLLAAASLGLQRLMVGISAWMPLQVALVVALVAWFVLSWRATPKAQRLARNLALALLMLRFAVPLSALLSEAAYRVFLAPEFEASSRAIGEARDKLMLQAEAVEPPAPADLSVIERAQQWLTDRAQVLDIEKQLAALEVTATEITGHVVNLIAVFTVQTMVLPLLFLWLGWRVLARWAPRVLGQP